MWKKLSDVTKEDMKALRREKKLRLYADEDIEPEAVQFLRSKGVNIASAHELGRVPRDDGDHAAFAFKEGRFILTKNAKHYMDDRAVPFTRLRGVITIEGDMGDMLEYARTLLRVLELVPYARSYTGMKIRLSPNQATFRFIDKHGHMVVQRFKVEHRDYYQWVD